MPAAQLRRRCGVALVGEPEPAEPLVARVEREQHVLVAGQLLHALGGVVGRRCQTEGGQDPARLGVGLGHLVLGVGVADQGGAGRDRHRAVGGDLRGADHDRGVGGGQARGVAAEQREGGPVVAAAVRLVAPDQPARVLHR